MGLVVTGDLVCASLEMQLLPFQLHELSLLHFFCGRDLHGSFVTAWFGFFVGWMVGFSVLEVTGLLDGLKVGFLVGGGALNSKDLEAE